MYGALELEKNAIKFKPTTLGDKKYIEPAPKGAEELRKKKAVEHGVLKRYDTEYKQGFLEPQRQE
jgi:hypothetical protein